MLYYNILMNVMSKNIIAEYVTALLVWHLFFIVAPITAQTFKKVGDFQDHLKLNQDHQ